MYDHTSIFRVEQGFVAQIENFTSRTPPLTAEQMKEVHKIPAEFSELAHTAGRISMARFDDPNSAESSFSFLLGNAPHLDHHYTVVGEVVEGLSTLRAIENVSVDSNHGPTLPVTVIQAEVFPAGDLSAVKLNIPVVKVSGPDQVMQHYFKVFAAFAFFITVGLAVAKNFFPKLRV